MPIATAYPAVDAASPRKTEGPPSNSPTSNEPRPRPEAPSDLVMNSSGRLARRRQKNARKSGIHQRLANEVGIADGHIGNAAGFASTNMKYRTMSASTSPARRNHFQKLAAVASWSVAVESPMRQRHHGYRRARPPSTSGVTLPPSRLTKRPPVHSSPLQKSGSPSAGDNVLGPAPANLRTKSARGIGCAIDDTAAAGPQRALLSDTTPLSGEFFERSEIVRGAPWR